MVWPSTETITVLYCLTLSKRFQSAKEAPSGASFCFVPFTNLYLYLYTSAMRHYTYPSYVVDQIPFAEKNGYAHVKEYSGNHKVKLYWGTSEGPLTEWMQKEHKVIMEVDGKKLVFDSQEILKWLSYA